MSFVNMVNNIRDKSYENCVRVVSKVVDTVLEMRAASNSYEYEASSFDYVGYTDIAQISKFVEEYTRDRIPDGFEYTLTFSGDGSVEKVKFALVHIQTKLDHNLSQFVASRYSDLAHEFADRDTYFGKFSFPTSYTNYVKEFLEKSWIGEEPSLSVSFRECARGSVFCINYTASTN